jgi:hypothetical protein
VPPVGFEPAIPASELQQTHALDSAAAEIGELFDTFPKSLKHIYNIFKFN